MKKIKWKLNRAETQCLHTHTHTHTHLSPYKIKTKKAFSLAEMMIVMLIVTLVLAATTPLITKRSKRQASSSGAVSLPIKNEGDSCVEPTSGKVGDNIAITPDHTTLLTCQPEASAGSSCSTLGAKAAQVDSGVVTHLVCQ